MLCFSAFVLESLEEFLDVTRHRKVDVALLVVPVESYSAIKFTFPINVDSVMFLESIE